MIQNTIDENGMDYYESRLNYVKFMKIMGMPIQKEIVAGLVRNYRTFPQHNLLLAGSIEKFVLN